MKQYLVPKDGDFYKANLHCHSTKQGDGGLFFRFDPSATGFNIMLLSEWKNYPRIFCAGAVSMTQPYFV